MCSDSHNQELMKNRETSHKAKNKELDHVLIEQIRQQRSKDMLMTSLLVPKQPRIRHEELSFESEYSECWLQKCKCPCIKYLKIFEKAPTDYKTTDEFAKIIPD